MPVYTVHEPPRGSQGGAAGMDRFVFVRDGFSWGAFVLAPLWLLRHRLWLALVLYVALLAALAATVKLLHLSEGFVALVGFLISFAIGLEASTLRRWTLSRRKWRTLAVVVGHDLEVAERRFFDAWLHRSGVSTSRSAISDRTSSPAPIIGLFPETEGRP
jgi:Protein of unknown function (DUF2628)